MRRLAPLLLVLTMAAGCTELTRFDYRFDDEDAATEPADAGPDAAPDSGT